MSYFFTNPNLPKKGFFLNSIFILLFFIYENYLLDYYLQKTTLFPSVFFYFRLILVILLLASNIIGGLLLMVIKGEHILFTAIILIGISTFFINIFNFKPMELNFWPLIPYTIAIGFIPVSTINFSSYRTEIIQNQRQNSNILLFSFIFMVLIFHLLFILPKSFQIVIDLGLVLILLISFFLMRKEKFESKVKYKNVSFLDFLLLIVPIFVFFGASFISNILYNSYFFYRSISGAYFFPFLIGAIGAFIISGLIDYLGRKILILSSFALVGISWIISSMFGYTLIISVLDGLAFGFIITVGIFTLSGDIIVEMNFKIKPFITSLFLAPLFLYDLAMSSFLLTGVNSNWLLFGFNIYWGRNSLFSLMIGLTVVGIVLFNYSPETYPMSKKEKLQIEKYMMKAKKLADKYEKV